MRAVNDIKQGLSKIELRNLKITLRVYKYKVGRYPDDLKQLADFFTKETSKRFGYMRLDTQGYPIDPFGDRFIYDKKTIAVKSKLKIEIKLEDIKDMF